MQQGSRFSCAVAAVLFVACKSGGGGGESPGPDGGSGSGDAGGRSGSDASPPGSGSGSGGKGSGSGGSSGDSGTRGSGSGSGSGRDPFAWANQTRPASKGSLVNAIAADSTGVVLVGQLQGSTVVSGTTYKASYNTSPGGNGVMIKYNTAGVAEWAVVDTATVAGGFSVFDAVAIDPTNGDIVVGATFTEKLTVAGTTITLPTAKLGGESPSTLGSAIIRFKSTGASVVWSQTMATTVSCSVGSLAVDGAGYVVAGGWNLGLTSFSTSTGSAVQLAAPTTASSNGDLYLARYGAGGDLQWAVTPPSAPAGNTIPTTDAVPPPPVPAIAVDSSDNIFLGVGSMVLGASGPDTTGGHVLLNKYTSAGALAWTEQATGTGGAYFTVTGLAVDPSGDPVMCGTVGSNLTGGVSTSLATFGTYKVTDPGFVAKYSSAGAPQWATGIKDGAALNFVFCAATASNVYAFAEAGLDSPHADVLSLDPATGVASTAPPVVATGQQVFPQAITTSGASVYIAGQIQYPATFGTQTFAGDGKSTVPFVAELAGP